MLEKRILIEETLKKIGEKVIVAGWVKTKRDHGKIVFLDLRDRSGVIQVVGQAEVFPEISPESVLIIEGTIEKRPKESVNQAIATGTIELKAEKVELLARASELPFDISKRDLNLSLPVLLDFRTLTLRHEKVSKIFKVQEAIVEAFSSVSKKLGCTQIFVPTICVSSTEGGAEVFSLDYYQHKAFLAQSPQLYKQMLVPVFERVFLISHAYRAEPSVTTRHLSESVQLDCEFGFVTFNQLLDYLEFMGISIVEYVKKTCTPILRDFAVEEFKIPERIPRLTLRQAQQKILERTGVNRLMEDDLTPEDEREICLWASQEVNSDFVTITHFPTRKRAFYTMPDPEDPFYSLSYDLLFRGVEVLSGSQRINDYGELIKAIKERGLNPNNFEVYLQAFKYGMPPEGGFSFGLERMTMQILGLKNVREASLFPRDMERVDLRLSSLKNLKRKKQKVK